MKKALFIILATFSLIMASAFCSGFKAGFKDGACYGKFGCIAPIAPICPIPGIGENDYMSGYNRGFLLGMSY